MSNQNLKETEYVRGRLQHYTERGIFSGLREMPVRNDKYRFSFRWLLASQFLLIWDEPKRQFLFEGLLPGLPYPSFLDRELRRFIMERSSATLPEHRRIDSEKAMLSYSNRSACGQIGLELKQGDITYGLRSTLTVINDLFTWLHLYHIDYLHKKFGLPEE